MAELTLDALLRAVKHSSMLRIDVRLQPASADGYVAPPTYAAVSTGKGPHVEFRRGFIDGQQRDIVVLDSPQSQSNRIEHAILAACDRGALAYPDIRLEFPNLPDEPAYSVLQLSHRVFDATLRACSLEGTPFPETAFGKAIYGSRPENATGMFTHAPVTLILGGWDSHGGGGPQVAKLPRLLTSEIVGLDAQPATRSATKVDPMDIRRNAAQLIKLDGDPRRFAIAEGDSKGKKADGKPKVNPSDLGFGSVPATGRDPVAATISEARQTSVISFTGLRVLRFPGGDKPDAERDTAGRAVLAALGLYGLLAQSESGYLLRSRCELIPLASKAQLLGGDAADIEVNASAAKALLDAALANARQHGLGWRDGILRLRADPRLEELVKRSRAMAASGEREDQADVAG